MAERVQHFDTVARQKSHASRSARLACATDAQKLTQTALPNMPADQLARVSRRCAEMPRKFRQTYVRAMGGKSIKAGVKAHCFECLGWETHPTDCTSPACALFPYRPGATG